ncbi:hypothetical protein C1645_873026 [Glomus cerebriforme]|uniref:Uncharacterized protein n=1 Tax=Glomus cerebriforme TaxID=658196 RepID=A0A397TJL3_9GLOM|nr:hypothetical protein C1645_873026 [Glomus cerebriforme]
MNQKLRQNMSFMGEKCLDFIQNNPIFQEKYRIELSPEDGLWNLYLHLDPVAWFDALMSRQNENRESVIKKAREYVNNYFIDIMQTLNAAAETNRNSIIANKRCSWFVEAPKIFCGIESPQQNRRSRSCNWYVEQERIIPFDERLNKLSIGFSCNELWDLGIGTRQRQKCGRLPWKLAPMSQA